MGGFKDAFVSSISMILVSELGDETFIIAAIMVGGGRCMLDPGMKAHAFTRFQTINLTERNLLFKLEPST